MEKFMNEDISATSTRERFISIMRRKLSEQGYSGDKLEAKLQEIQSKQELSFSINWDKATIHE